MGRYGSTKVRKIKYNTSQTTDRKGSLSYRTTIYEKIPKRDSDIQIITQEGDRLDNLALQFYGNPKLWWYIAKANNLTSLNVEKGLNLRVPVSTEFAKGK